jgi:hypothetical protein
MKRAAAKSMPTLGGTVVREAGALGNRSVHDPGGKAPSYELQQVAKDDPAKVAEFHYDADDIEEAKRIGAALERQHAL